MDEEKGKIVIGRVAKNAKKSVTYFGDKKHITLEFDGDVKKEEDVVAVIVRNGKMISEGKDGKEPGIDSGTGIGTGIGGGSEIDSGTGIGTGIGGGPEIDSGTGIGTGIGGGSEIDSGTGIGTGICGGSGVDIGDGYDGISTGTGEGSSIENSGSNTKDDESKKRLGKALKVGALGLAGLFVAVGILTAKDVSYQTYNINSDYQSINEVSDLYTETQVVSGIERDSDGRIVIKYGDEIEYSASQTQNPGKLISDLRERGIAENLGRYSGRQAYDQIPEEQRVADEEKINEISKAFDTQLEKIAKAREVIENLNSTEDEKKAALETIRGAKQTQLSLYSENQTLFNRYMEIAFDAYENPSDERTKDDESYLVDILNSWNDSQSNLEGDISGVNNSLYIIEHPETLFEEPSAPVGTVETDHYINIPEVKIPFTETKIGGQSFIKSEENEIYDLEYDTDTEVSETKNIGDGQAQEGKITEDSTEMVTVKTTRYGINAFVHNFKSFYKGLLEKITGKNLTDPKAPKDNNQGR